MFDRNRRENQRAFRQLHDSAVRLATSPSGARIGVAGNTSSISSVITGGSRADANGNTVAPLLFDVDNWDAGDWS